jgi:hypothetical protein
MVKDFSIDDFSKHPEDFMKLTLSEAKKMIEAAGWKIEITLVLEKSIIRFKIIRKDLNSSLR